MFIEIGVQFVFMVFGKAVPYLEIFLYLNFTASSHLLMSFQFEWNMVIGTVCHV